MKADADLSYYGSRLARVKTASKLLNFLSIIFAIFLIAN